MALKARLQRNAGNYRFRGEVWELGFPVHYYEVVYDE